MSQRASGVYKCTTHGGRGTERVESRTGAPLLQKWPHRSPRLTARWGRGYARLLADEWPLDCLSLKGGSPGGLVPVSPLPPGPDRGSGKTSRSRHLYPRPPMSILNPSLKPPLLGPPTQASKEAPGGVRDTQAETRGLVRRGVRFRPCRSFIPLRLVLGRSRPSVRHSCQAGDYPLVDLVHDRLASKAHWAIVDARRVPRGPLRRLRRCG